MAALDRRVAVTSAFGHRHVADLSSSEYGTPTLDSGQVARDYPNANRFVGVEIWNRRRDRRSSFLAAKDVPRSNSVCWPYSHPVFATWVWSRHHAEIILLFAAYTVTYFDYIDETSSPANAKQIPSTGAPLTAIVFVLCFSSALTGVCRISNGGM